MPRVSKAFVEHAVALAKNAQTEKQGSDAGVEQGQLEMVADTLIEQGLVPANQKQAAIEKLRDPGETLQILNKTAQMVRAATIGESVESHEGHTKIAHDEDGEPVRESDRQLYSALGLM
jgi:hypothetical protein